MYQYKGLEDTIAAIATPAGQGGIGIIRISGIDAIVVADKLLRLHGKKKLATCESHTLHHGWLLDKRPYSLGGSGESFIDEVLVSVMRAPRTYTAEDVIEINCHGGMTVLQAVLQEIINAGARLATPGEFTKRAFINGRMDLAQAEAVMDVISAKTTMFLRQSQHQLKGELSTQLNAIRDELLKLYTMVEALINFPEDGLDTKTHQEILNRLGVQVGAVAKLLEGSNSGRLFKTGIRIVLCGKPNVGKSSLLNALLKQERAIVTDIAGTTRDVLEESAQIKGIPISLVDTAGILHPRDLIEEEAIKRSHLYIKSADLVLLVLDNSRALEGQDRFLLEQLKDDKVLVVINKMDLKEQLDAAVPVKIFSNANVIRISALDAASIGQLEDKIIELVRISPHLDTHGILISNIRHIKALEEAGQNLQDAGRLLTEQTSLEFISEEIKSAVNQMDAITGRNIDEDLLDRIFSDFCIGK